MYGVPENLDLGFLRRAELIQICIAKFQVQLHFHPVGSISIEGGWELYNVAGECLDRRHEELQRPSYQLHRLLGQCVVESEISAPNWFALRFESGDLLRIFDDSPQYESFQIQPGDIIV